MATESLDVTIRELRSQGDAELLEELYRNVLQPSFSVDELETLESMLSRLEAEDETTLLAAVAVDGAGNVVAGLVGELYPDVKVLLLGYVAVRPDVRRRGVGSQLILQVVPRWYARADVRLALGEVHDPRFWPQAPDEDAISRLRLYGRLGGRLLDVPFVQPALDAQRQRVRGFLLLVTYVDHTVSIERDGRTYIPADVVSEFIQSYFATVEDAERPYDLELAALVARTEARPQIALLGIDEYESIPPLDT